MIELRYSRRALADLEDIRRYISKEDPQTAERVLRHLQNRIAQLAVKPDLGVAARQPRFRILSPTKYPYRIYFEVFPDHLAILHVRHTSRQLPRLRGFHEP